MSLTSECSTLQCSVNINSNEQFLKSGQWPQLTVYSAGHSLQVFVNGQSYGTVYPSDSRYQFLLLHRVAWFS